MRSKLPRAGFEELGIDWGPASPFGSDDDPGTPMTHQDSSESDELRPDLFEPGAAPLPAPEPVVVFEHDSFRRGGQGELYLVQRRKRKKHEGAQRDADREAEVQSLRSRVTELERRLSQLEAENAQLRSRDYSLQLA